MTAKGFVPGPPVRFESADTFTRYIHRRAAKEQRILFAARLQLYQSAQWWSKLALFFHMKSSRSYELIGAAFGLGSDNRGTMGAPAAYRRAGVLERLQRLGFSVAAGSDIGLPTGFPLDGPGADPRLRNLAGMEEFARLMIPALRAIYSRGATPVVLGGDHALSMVTITVAA
jgi:arginase family enzyme